MKKLKAFTLSETVIALSVFGILTTLGLLVLFNDETRKEKIKIMTSRELFFNIDKIYQDILVTNCKNMGRISTLKDINGDGEVDSKDIRDVIIKTYGGEALNSCQELITPSNFSKNNMECLDMMPVAIIGVYFDKNCTTSVNACDSYDQTPKSYSNTCGYIAYSLKKSEGTLGKDFFIYPMLNKAVTKKVVKIEEEKIEEQKD